MKVMVKLFVILFYTLFSICACAQTPNITFESSTSFYPTVDILNNDNIEWGFFTVPEDWDVPNGKKIKLAVSILRSHSKVKDTNPIVMLDGGPGGGSIEGIWWFLNHPIRDEHDVILIDARGTGFSTPRLCPELGNKFLNILAKDQSPLQDSEDKIVAAMACKQQLVGKGINVNAYHSRNVAKDLHAAKEYFNYSSWNVYGVSYGTYVAQVYANEFPADIKTLVLDSPISDISKYYSKNTSNYISSLNKVFQVCLDDPSCNSEYPDLESTYYNVIEELTKSPMTVEVDKSIIKEGTFTYNAEDYKIAIHQALYQKRLIEILPLLIYQFHNRNKDALSALVAAFSGALELDYGLYYCVSCTEAIPMNSIEEYDANANKYPRLSGGLSFYSSDFAVCNKWNEGNRSDQVEAYSISKNNIQTLIFTGGYDPITPSENGDSLTARIGNSSLINAENLGHASSFSREGFEIFNKFISEPNTRINNVALSSNTDIKFVRDVYVNGGVSKLGNSINNFDPLFFAPLIIALLILIAAIVVFLFGFIRRKKKRWISKGIVSLLSVTSILGIGVLTGLVLALKNTTAINFYILAIGVPEKWSFLFTVLLVFFGVLVLSCVYFIFIMNKIENRSLIFTVLFSNILLGGYFMYWGFLSAI